MKRGLISNTTSPTVWVMSDVVLELGERLFWVGPKREEIRRADWLWRVNDGFEAVIICINRTPNANLADYSHKTFKTMPSAVSAFRSDLRAGLFIVEDTAKTAPPDIVAYSRSAGIFHGH